jgi:hypothetical protein
MATISLSKRLVLLGVSIAAAAGLQFLVRSSSADVTDPQPIGCFRDQGDPYGTNGRDLNGYVTHGPNMTTAACISECSQRGFAYAGTQYGEWCFCGSSYGRSGTADNCNMACSGKKSEVCGGPWANTVYSTAAGGAGPVSAPPHHVAQTINQPESRDPSGKITVEAANIEVITCDTPQASKEQFYIYEYVNRHGYRAILPPNWGHALGGRDFDTKEEAIAAACSTAPH